ncbi:MAG: nicotinamide riboside transporter PnuC [Perlabentimonas sp.]
MIDWLQANYIEVLGAVTGIIFLYLEIKENIWLWPFGIATSTLYIYIFFVSKFYADMGLQFYYLAISLYGWWHWLYGGKREGEDTLPISRITVKLAAVLFVVSIAIFAVTAYVLINFTDSPVPYGDAFTTALSVVATWMLAHKILEMWWVWVLVNAVAMGLYIYKGLYPTSVLFFLYFSMSIVGYLQWKRSYVEVAKR